MTTVTEYAHYIATHPTRPQGGPWAGPGFSYCTELCTAAGGFNSSFATATAAGNAVESLSHNTPDLYDFIYFTDHVALYVGNNTMLCCSSALPSPGTGEIGIPEWEARFPTNRYRFASKFFGNETLETPTPTPTEEITMRLVLNPTTHLYTVVGNGNPYPASGNANQLGAFAAVFGATYAPTAAADYDQFIKNCTNPAPTEGGGSFPTSGTWSTE